MVLVDMKKPKSCKHCKLRNNIDDCSVTGKDVASEVDNEVIAESCPIKGELEKTRKSNYEERGREMTKEIALHCMKSASELKSELCEECPIYGQTGSDHCFEEALQYVIEMLEQEPKRGHCKSCKWWKDSDGLYRRGGHAESQCPINRREVLEGNGYCYMFEPHEKRGINV